MGKHCWQQPDVSIAVIDQSNQVEEVLKDLLYFERFSQSMRIEAIRSPFCILYLKSKSHSQSNLNLSF